MAKRAHEPIAEVRERALGRAFLLGAMAAGVMGPDVIAPGWTGALWFFVEVGVISGVATGVAYVLVGLFEVVRRTDWGRHRADPDEP